MKSFNKWRNQCVSNKVFDVINIIAMTFVLLVCFYPLYYILILSFSDEVVGTYIWPEQINLTGYKLIFAESTVYIGYANTIFYTVVGVVCSLAVTLPCAYSLSRKDFKGRGPIMGFLMVTMFISGGLVPGYLNVYNLGLLDTRWIIIILGLTSTYNIIISRTFFQSTIPGELLDAAKIDGCGNGRFFFGIVLPLSKPIMAVMALYFGVGRWNSYFTEMVYLRDESKYPLALFLRRLLWEMSAIETMMEKGEISLDAIGKAEEMIQTATIMQYCLIVVSTIPMLIIYPYLQKYFAKGVMIGSVKG